MKIVFLQRPTGDTHWGGDLMVLQNFCQGLLKLGHKAKIVREIEDALDADFVFLSNVCMDLRPYTYLLNLTEKKFGVIGFYEDILQYHSPSRGFYHYVRNILSEEEDLGYTFSVDRLVENPELIYYYPEIPKKCFFINYDVLQRANLFIASSPTEVKTLLRDCSTCRAQHILFKQNFSQITDSSVFLDFTNLKSKEYILQVGRFEHRKNQLATILATRDLDIPLVFIATKHFKQEESYLVDSMKAILKWRKAPTIIVSENIQDHEEGNLRILQMPNATKLSEEMLTSAFFHAGLYVHPAFYELPGSVYLEAARLGTPVVASKWTAIRDYFTDEETGRYLLDDRIEYALPYDIRCLTELIQKKFGKRYSVDPDYPIFRRENTDMAKELLKFIKPILDHE